MNSSWWYNTLVANGFSKELFTLLESIVPDIIFLDINLPGHSGVECLKRIRSDAKYNSIPVIMRSTTGNPNTIEECYRLRADYYVIKAQSLNVMVERFKKLLSTDWKTVLRPSRENFVISND